MKIYQIASSSSISDKMKDDLERYGDLTVIHAKKMPVNEVLEKAADAEILVIGPASIENVSRELLEGLKNLKLISVLSIGVEWIDIEAAKEFGITICTIKGSTAESDAEHAWGMILDVGKRISEFDRDARNTGAYKIKDYVGKEVYQKTIGIIGLGDIGKKIARIAKGFEMRIIGTNQSGTLVRGVELVDMDTLLKESDIIVTTTPLTSETRNMISENEVSKMKDGVILVNPSREGLTDKEAILKGLNSGKIFGFGIETDIMKQIPKDSPYYKHPRVVATPHNAFNTEEANMNSYESAVENVRAFFEGNPQNVVV